MVFDRRANEANALNEVEGQLKSSRPDCPAKIHFLIKNHMLDKRTKKILHFLKEIEKLKLVLRIPYLSDQKRRENDAEHSWHLAMTVLVLANELDIKFDVSKAIKLALVHDIVEIYTGDDWHPTEADRKLKSANEEISAKKIFGMLPTDLATEFYDLWQEYEKGTTIEAKVTKACDRLAYPLQYSVSKKIEFRRRVTDMDARAYALPALEFNQKMIEIAESLYTEIPPYHDPKEKS
ncbi:MAG TPA: HD domain-containing protein [Patescibacteria group bacterium]|nr:HD domain-containing protein [Patescibacteria group bacterium]